MFGRTRPRHARRGRRSSEREQAVRRLNRITPPSGIGSLAERADLARTVAEQAVSAHALPLGSQHAGGWVPRGRVAGATADADDDDDGPPTDPRMPIGVRLAGRFGVSPAHVVVVVIGLVLALVLTAGVLLRSRPRAVDVAAVPVAGTSQPTSPAPTGPAPTGPAPTGPASTTAPQSSSAVPAASAVPTAEVVVQVIGRVRRPGVVRLPAGSRVVDAVVAAGGVRKGAHLGTLNLARPLVDGEQIAVGLSPANSAGSSGTSGGGAVPPVVTPPAVGGTPSPGTVVVSLNTADLVALETLPGVGPVLAQRILDFRAENGSFASVDELRDVKGIGDKTFAELAPHVTL